MKHFFVMAIVALASGIDIRASSSKDIEQLKEDKVGNFLLDLAQLHGQTIGPLDDLKVAINKLDEDLQEQLKALETAYTQKTGQHNKVQQALELNIGEAQIEIAQSQDTVDNFLSNTKENYESRLKEVQDNIADNRQKVDRSKLERQKEAQQSTDRIHQHSMATNAIDEALQLVMGLINGNIGFAEVHPLQTISKGTHAPNHRGHRQQSRQKGRVRPHDRGHAHHVHHRRGCINRQADERPPQQAQKQHRRQPQLRNRHRQRKRIAVQ